MTRPNLSSVHKKLEDLSIFKREAYERAYKADPVRMHNELVYSGYWDMAAQLQIDLAVGRL